MTAPHPRHHVALALQQVGRVPGITPGMKGREIRQAGVVGAGLMGAGIAVCLLAAGIPTVLVDRNEDALTRGRQSVAAALATLHKRGHLFEGMVSGLQELLSTSLEDADLAGCDIVIEAVYERLDVKEAVFRRLAAVTRPGAILATNTSGLDVDRIAAASGRAADVIGLHFFSPAYMMPLLEIVRGRATSPEVLRTALFLATVMRKTGVVVGNCHGFAANRSLEGYGREAERLILEGADPADIDRAFTAFGFPMGPCAMGDLAGLDVRVHYLQAMQDSGLIPDDPRYGLLTRALVAAGRLGQKSGAGHHDYGADGRTPVPSDTVKALRDKLAAAIGVPQRSFTDEEIVMRCLLPVINEAAKLVAEGIVQQPSDVDVLWLYGYGFPAAKGGPVYLARQWGFDKVHAALRAQAAADPRYGAAYWAPSPALPQLFA